jgi:hypothetical protein
MKYTYIKTEVVKVSKVITPADVYCRNVHAVESVKKTIREYLTLNNLEIVGFRPVRDYEKGLLDRGHGVELGTCWKNGKQTSPRFIVEPIPFIADQTRLDEFWE